MKVLTASIGLIAILGCSTALPVHAEPDPGDAASLFTTGKRICEADKGRLWGVSLCGPILLVDYHDRRVLANQPDPEGRLVRDGQVYRGVLPDDVIIANTPTEWAGVRWTQIVTPLPVADNKLSVLAAHELFHRIQPSLGLSRPDIGNQHLDTLQGRYLLQLEWRALARALRARSPLLRRSAISDALAFRQERYKLFPTAANEERALEIAEGVPEYTGVKLGLTNDRDRRAFAIANLSAFVEAPTFVRSFAYATGAAYGLLLDRADPGWVRKLRAGGHPDMLLADAMAIKSLPPDSQRIQKLASNYDAGPLWASEVQRDQARQQQLSDYRARLIDGPVLTLPLKNSNIQFNPQTLVPLEGVGMVYPSMRLVDDWGALEVEGGGALVDQRTNSVSVPALGMDPDHLATADWRLTLKPGWSVIAGHRSGDLSLNGNAKR